MKSIKLTRGKEAIVDDQDYATLSLFKWYALKERGKWYAARYVDGWRKRVFMHREILGAQVSSINILFRDKNTLNNTRANLKIAEPMKKIFELTKNIKFITELWLIKPDSEILFIPEPIMNYSFFPKECHCGQIFYTDKPIPNHICRA